MKVIYEGKSRFQLIDNEAGGDRKVPRGQVVDVGDGLGAQLIAQGWAKATEPVKATAKKAADAVKDEDEA